MATEIKQTRRLSDKDLFRPTNQNDRIPDSKDTSLDRAKALVEAGNINAHQVAQLTYKTHNRHPISGLPLETNHYLRFVDQVRELIAHKHN